MAWVKGEQVGKVGKGQGLWRGEVMVKGAKSTIANSGFQFNLNFICFCCQVFDEMPQRILFLNLSKLFLGCVRIIAYLPEM